VNQGEGCSPVATPFINLIQKGHTGRRVILISRRQWNQGCIHAKVQAREIAVDTRNSGLWQFGLDWWLVGCSIT
jgi:hypothetical protein